VPSYFVDKHILVHLAFILSPQLGDDALEKIALDYLDEDEEDPEMVIEEEPMMVTQEVEEETEMMTQEVKDRNRRPEGG
jgi:hypothetical protein